MERLSTELIEWAVASRSCVAGEESGDACLVRALPESALVALVDGLGHGPAAAAAARRAIRLLEKAERVPPLETLLACHESLRFTRGAVLSLARFDGIRNLMTWAGVGDVGGTLLRAARGRTPNRETLLPRRGILGRQLPPLHAALVPVEAGDTLVLATDGVDPRFMHGLECPASLQAAADRILTEFADGADDATVLVVRYRGTAE